MTSNQAGTEDTSLGRVELYNGWMMMPGRAPSSSASVDGSASSRGAPSKSSSTIYLDHLLQQPSAMGSEDEVPKAEGHGGSASCGGVSPRRTGSTSPRRRANKSQSEVYSKLVSKLEEHVKADPFRFEFARCRLPPFVASSEERRVKLQKQLEAFAAGLTRAEGLPHGWQPTAGAPSVLLAQRQSVDPSTMSSSGIRNPSVSSSSGATSARPRRVPLKMSL